MKFCFICLINDSLMNVQMCQVFYRIIQVVIEKKSLLAALRLTIAIISDCVHYTMKMFFTYKEFIVRLLGKSNSLITKDQPDSFLSRKEEE